MPKLASFVELYTIALERELAHTFRLILRKQSREIHPLASKALQGSLGEEGMKSGDSEGEEDRNCDSSARPHGGG